MPIFEYKCLSCGNEFESLILPPATPTAVCPACQSQELERLLSGFAVSSDGIRQSNIASARRRFAASSNLRDQKIAEGEEVREHLQEDYGVDVNRKTPAGPK